MSLYDQVVPIIEDFTLLLNGKMPQLLPLLNGYGNNTVCAQQSHHTRVVRLAFEHLIRICGKVDKMPEAFCAQSIIQLPKALHRTQYGGLNLKLKLKLTLRNWISWLL